MQGARLRTGSTPHWFRSSSDLPARQWTRDKAERAALPVSSRSPARTEAPWWQNNIVGAADTFMLHGRLSFGNGAPRRSRPRSSCGERQSRFVERKPTG
jgi:hypothetical protein